MIDFYGRLGIDIFATETQLRSAIAMLRSKDRSMADRAEAILLSPARRRAYDRLWHALTRIGQARAIGGLSHAPFGGRPEYAEFRFKAPQNAEADQSPAPSGGSISALNLRTVASMGALAFIGYMILTNVGYMLLENEDRAPVQKAPNIELSTPSSAYAPTAPEPWEIAAQQLREKVEVAHPVQPLPKTGWGPATGVADRDSWIDIKTSGEHHTLVRIENLSGKRVALRFIRATESLRIYLPLGTYVMKTATGRQWYGLEYRFGHETSYGKPDDTFPLNERGEYWTVELIPQQDGNLRERKISEQEFGS